MKSAPYRGQTCPSDTEQSVAVKTEREREHRLILQETFASNKDRKAFLREIFRFQYVCV